MQLDGVLRPECTYINASRGAPRFLRPPKNRRSLGPPSAVSVPRFDFSKSKTQAGINVPICRFTAWGWSFVVVGAPASNLKVLVLTLASGVRRCGRSGSLILGAEFRRSSTPSMCPQAFSLSRWSSAIIYKRYPAYRLTHAQRTQSRAS